MKNKRDILILVILAAAFSFMLMGMAGMGPTSSGGQGANLVSYQAKLMDTENNSVEITSATIDGKTAFQAYMGKGKIVVPFDQISRIEIKGKNACVSMKNSQRICNLRIKETARVEGNTSFGLYQIPLNDVVWIELSKAK